MPKSLTLGIIEHKYMTRSIIKDMNRSPRKSRKGERGQVAMLFALVFTFMFVLFAFVIDFGHLVHLKMNLQLAADKAAYSGAAWQARVLNRIGHANYHVRQVVKELGMRIHVTHMRHNRGFPRGGQNGGPGPPNVEPWICQQAHGYRALSGLRYENNTNLCRNASPSVGGLPPIVVPPVIAAFDPFAVAISQQIRRIADAANQECQAAASDNRVLAQHLVSTYTARSQFHAQKVQALQGYLNSIPTGPVQRGQHEAVDVAIDSATNNLARGLGRDADFQLEVIQPRGGEFLRLVGTNLRASVFFIDFNVVGDGCVGRPNFLDFDGVSAGFSKDSNIITYFAVKAVARPRMFFMPQAWVDAAFPTLEAFAAAKPFGSRIGPQSITDELLPVPGRPGNTNRMVNFSMRAGDTLGIMNTKLMGYLDSLHPFNSVGRPQGEQNDGWPEPNKPNNRLALQAVRAPNMFDAAFFTIFPDPTETQDYDESNYAFDLFPDYVEAAGANNNIIQTRQPTTDPYLPTSGTENGTGWVPLYSPGGGGGSYGNYATEQPGSHSTTLAGNHVPNVNDGNANEFGWATRSQLHSGWSPQREPGRIGYSVKLISFDTLIRTLQSGVSGSRSNIENIPSGDEDLVKLFH